jgi:transposase
MVTKEVYVDIQVLRKHGLSLRKIADEVGCAVNTVRRHLVVGTPPQYQRTRRKPTKLLPFHGYLAERQKAAHPHWIPATV